MGAVQGYTAGQTAAGIVAPQKQVAAVTKTQQVGMPQAMARRIDTMQASPQTQLAQANAALAKLPPEYQQAYGPVLTAAQQRAAQGGSNA
jgi:hypothetical protein